MGQGYDGRGGFVMPNRGDSHLNHNGQSHRHLHHVLIPASDQPLANLQVCRSRYSSRALLIAGAVIENSTRDRRFLDEILQGLPSWNSRCCSASLEQQS